MKNHRIYYSSNPLILAIICINVSLINTFITITVASNLKEDVSHWVIALIGICFLVVTLYICVKVQTLFQKNIFKLLDKQDEKSKEYHLDNFLHGLYKDIDFRKQVLNKDYKYTSGGNNIILSSTWREILNRKEKYINKQ